MTRLTPPLPPAHAKPRAPRGLSALALVAAVALALSSLLRGQDADADAPVFGPTDVPTAFSVRRSLNRNRVDYAVRLNASCQAASDEPVEPYWRMLETDGSLAPLLLREQRAYGVAQQVVQPGRRGSRIRVSLRALAERTVSVRTRPGARGCVAESVMRIAGVEARVQDIYVVLAGPVSVNRVELRGVALDGGQPVEEALRE